METDENAFLQRTEVVIRTKEIIDVVKCCSEETKGRDHCFWLMEDIKHNSCHCWTILTEIQKSCSNYVAVLDGD